MVLGFEKVGNDVDRVPDIRDSDIELHPSLQRSPDAVIVGVNVDGFLVCELNWLFHPAYALE